MTPMMVVGSYALRDFMPGMDAPKDLDLIGSYEEVRAAMINIESRHGPVREQYPLGQNKLFMRTESLIVEAEIAWPGSTGEEFLKLATPGRIKFDLGFQIVIPDINALYALKMSHRYLKNAPSFLKTMHHIEMMRTMGASIQPEFVDWFFRREKETYSYGHPKLSKDKQQFFAGDQVQYQYDHDSIHEAIKIGRKPAYSLFAAPGKEVLSSELLFSQQTYQVRINAVLEECYVLALERSQIPFPEMDSKRSFEIALEKVCTSITSGWFREFAWENYNQVLHAYNPKYVEWFQRGLRIGIVKPYGGKNAS